MVRRNSQFSSDQISDCCDQKLYSSYFSIPRHQGFRSERGHRTASQRGYPFTIKGLIYGPTVASSGAHSAVNSNRTAMQRDNQHGNPATIRMRMRRCWGDEGRREGVARPELPQQRRRRPKGPHLAVTAAGNGSASPSRGPILWPAGMSPINK
jgi:hypothetical protein